MKTFNKNHLKNVQSMKKLLALEGKVGVEPTINNAMSIPLFLILPRHPLVRPDNAYLRHNHGFTLQWMTYEKNITLFAA